MWLVHLATTHGPNDMEMLKNVLAFCEAVGVKNVVFMSTWSVLFPRVGGDAAYTTVKRDCETLLASTALERRVVIRPSVVRGGGEQQWDAVLTRLAPFGPMLGGLHRCFVTLDAVVETIVAVVSGRESRDVITLLGERRSLKHAVPASRLATPVAVLTIAIVVTLAVVAVVKLRRSPVIAIIVIVAIIVGWFAIRHSLMHHSFARSFVCADVWPRNAADVLSLSNEKISVRGDNNKNDFFSPNSAQPHKIIASLRYLDWMTLDVDEATVHVGAGVTFRELLPYLRSKNMALQNYPNYHTITIGACIATPVHGSDLQKPFLVDLVQSFTYVHAGDVHDVDRASPERFYKTIFTLPKGSMVVAAQLSVKRSVVKYRVETRVIAPGDLLNFLKETSTDAACEVRQNKPRGRMIATMFRSVEDCQTCPELKADAIGRVWNNIDHFRPIARAISRLIVNFEWFVRPEQLSELVDEIQASPFYKLLFRYNRAPEPAAKLNPFYGTVSIDISCPVFGLERAKALYDRFQPYEHSGKHMIGRRYGEHRAYANHVQPT